MILDTHMFLWWLFDDPRLPPALKDHLRMRRNRVCVSAASVWEIATKFRLGKLPEAGEVARDIPRWIERAGFEALSITPEHAQLAGQWLIMHRDPFDRMLAAQAKIEDMPLATVDGALHSFPIELVPGKHVQ
ncbi:MAG: type II toxin-antitoxin system VapC family toxin [Desulfohalobiaceae bacterium]|nr:type II toxin-antitoxin system VapC family toxin [Desulfohalobiaceae bacterium]